MVPAHGNQWTTWTDNQNSSHSYDKCNSLTFISHLKVNMVNKSSSHDVGISGYLLGISPLLLINFTWCSKGAFKFHILENFRSSLLDINLTHSITITILQVIRYKLTKPFRIIHLRFISPKRGNGFWKTRNDGIFRGKFRGSFFKNFRNGSKWSKYTYVWVIAYSERYFPITRFSGKHGILDGIRDNLLKSSIYTFYSTVNVPVGHTIILCEFAELMCKASHDSVLLAYIRFQGSSDTWRGIIWPFVTVCNQ